MTWTNPADADLAAVIVRRATGATAPATPTDGTSVTLPGQTATGVTDTTLDPNTTYSYAVFTRDTTGNTSTPATLTTATTASPEVYSVFNYPSRDSRTRPSETNWCNCWIRSRPGRRSGLVLHHLPQLSGGGRPHRRARPRCDRARGP